MKKYVYLLTAGVCFVLGTIGIILPILPTVPFYLLTVYFLARSSTRLHDRFINSKLYEKHLKSYHEKRGMTVDTKASIIISVSIIMGIAFICMRNTPIGRMIIVFVWACHLIYFVFGVKTISE